MSQQAQSDRERLAAARIVIVGAGQAGGRAAEALRSAGHAGPITLIGEEVHPPYERPQLSKAILIDETPAPEFLRSAADWSALEVELSTGAAAIGGDLDRGVIGLADGREFKFDRLLLATGTRPRRLPALEQGDVPVHYLRGLDDALALRGMLLPGQRIVLVGGGVIGLEVAAAALARGCEVTVVEATPRLLPQAGSSVLSDYLAGLHRARGLAVRCGVTATGPVPGGIALSDGSALAADLILVGIGVEPAVELARDLGLDAEGGIRVDESGATASDRVFAAGDVALQWNPVRERWLRVENWANAQNQAMAAARTMAGERTAYGAPSWFWSDQFDVNIQVVGYPALGEEVVRGDVESGRFAAFSLRDGEVVGGVTVNAAKDMATMRRLVAGRKRVAPGDLADPGYDLRRALRD